MNEKPKKVKIPWWARQRIACPNCGFLVTEELEYNFRIKNQFDCPRCKASEPLSDFWEAHHDKYDRTADLSGEQD